MTGELTDKHPRCLWSHFEDFLKIPRPSGHEENIRNHIMHWAASQGYELRKDTVGNLIVYVPATAGCEKAPTVILQAHLDMVTVKQEDLIFDFLVDPIQYVIDNDYLRSTGTTLGADNGIGVAAAMAVAEDETAQHGKLELLFTVDEETGLTGAKGLDHTLISGRHLVNLDSEDDAIYIGCAGAQDCHMRFPIRRTEDHKLNAPLRISVHGLKGGHSGVTIHENSGNAIKILARVLNDLATHALPFGVVSIVGGGHRNAIPREASALIRIDSSTEEQLSSLVATQRKLLLNEYREIDRELRVDIGRTPDRRSIANIWREQDCGVILKALVACPHGVQSLSRVVSGLVETSNNLATVETTADSFVVQTLSRSSVLGALEAITSEIGALFELAGASFEKLGGYPAWRPDPKSELLDIACKVYQELRNESPEIKAIHAGLECGIIGGKLHKLEMISIGPEIFGAHTPQESVKISSVSFFYRHLKGVLSKLSQV